MFLFEGPNANCAPLTVSSGFSPGKSLCQGKIAALLLGIVLLGGCISRPERFETKAMAAHLIVTELDSGSFRHKVYARPAATEQRNDLAIVFIEGDGLPWTDGGTRIADDPTPRRALALELLLKTRAPAWYLTRPCYNGLLDLRCNPSLWTDARYSKAVVVSMTAALQQHARAQGIERILLIGYSGGGTLAMLIAPHLDNLAGVVTIAANLDVSAWTAAHGYLPLDASLNPADEPPYSKAPIVHFIGERDATVPPSTLTRYFETHAGEEAWRYPDFDHRCCWVERWPELLERALRKTGN